MTEQKQTIALPVEGMTCASCVSHVQKALESVPGVDGVAVNLASESASVRFDPALVGLDRLSEAVRDAGYGVASEDASLPIGGMTCASCVAHIERALSSLPGMVQVNVNLATEMATVRYLRGELSLADMRRAVADAGYEVLSEPEAEEEEGLSREEQQMRDARRRMVLSWAFTVPIILWMLPEMLAGIAWPSMTVFSLGMLALAVPVLFWVGRRTYVAAWRSSIHGAPNMDALIALGTGAATSVGLVTVGGTTIGLTALEFGQDGVLYSLPNVGELTSGNLLSIDTATGNATDLGFTGEPALVALTVPEPSTLALLGLAGLVCCRRR